MHGRKKEKKNTQLEVECILKSFNAQLAVNYLWLIP